MRFEYHSGFQCWTLRRFVDVQSALKDPQRFAVSLVSDFDESGQTRTLRQAMDTFLETHFNRWVAQLQQISLQPTPEELVSQWIEPWCHAAALQLVTVAVDRGHRLRDLARKAFEAGAFLNAPPAATESQELDAQLPSVLGPLTVQAFIATSQSLAAFLANAAAALFDRNIFYPHTPRALEELLRFAGPSQAQFRYLTETVGDRPKGTRIALLLAEANRDADQFPDPDRLHFTRSDGGHLAFGYGSHACAGAALIRAAAPVILKHLTELQSTSELESIEWPQEARAIRSPIAIRIREPASAKMRYQE